MPLDADIAVFLERIDPNGFDANLPEDASPEALERSLKALRTLPVRPIAPDDPVTARDEQTDGGVRLRIYGTADMPDAAPVAIFLHGGGWVLGDLDTHDHVARAIARAGVAVVSVDYRLAPEHPFPAALDDVASALDWVAARATSFGGDPAKIVTVGVSSGANLAAALSLLEARDGSRRVVAQALAYPPLDSRMATRSYEENAAGYHLTAKQMAFFWDQYVPREGDRTNPLASLAHADSLEGFPPTVVLTAEFDPLRDEGDEFARRLAAAGVHVEHVQVAGVLHGFLAMDGQFCAAAAPALADLVARAKQLAEADSVVGATGG